MKYEIKNIDPGDMIWAAAGACFPIVWFYGSWQTLLEAGSQGFNPIDLFAGVILTPIFISVVIGLVTGIAALSYNLTATKIGGVKIEIESVRNE